MYQFANPAKRPQPAQPLMKRPS